MAPLPPYEGIYRELYQNTAYHKYISLYFLIKFNLYVLLIINNKYNNIKTNMIK